MINGSFRNFGRLGPLLLMVASLFVLQSCLTEQTGHDPLIPGGGDTLDFKDTIPDTLSSSDKYLAKGQEYYRNGAFGSAMGAFDTAILLDSSNAQAYYGHAKATLSFFKVDRISILSDFETTAGGASSFPMLEHSDSVLTLRLQAASRVRKKLSILTERDSLTRWYRYLTDSVPSAEALADPSYQNRRAFMQDYLVKADLGLPGYRPRSSFPLSDLRIPSTSFFPDYLIMELTYTITRLYDLDQNDTIDSRDALMKKLIFGNADGFSVDSLSTIAGDIENDTAVTTNLNALISGMQSGLLGTSQLAGLIDSGDGSGQGPTGSAGSDVDSVLADLGSAVSFYQFGDRLDNDGDGCIDEEVLDNKDNDFDGFVDEDARVIPDDKPDQVDNDRNGRMDPVLSFLPFQAGNDSLESRVGVVVDPARPEVLGFVRNYLLVHPSDNNADPLLTNWVKIKKNATPEQMQLRIAIQRDSLAVRIPAGSPVPDSLKAKLSNAKSIVGGCWRNY